MPVAGQGLSNHSLPQPAPALGPWAPGRTVLLEYQRPGLGYGPQRRSGRPRFGGLGVRADSQGRASPGRDSPRTRRMTVTIRARWLCLLPLRRGRASGPGLRQASPGPPKRPALGLGSEWHWHATQFRPTTWRQPARTQSHQFCRQGLLLGTVTDSRQTVIAARVGSAGHASHCGS